MLKPGNLDINGNVLFSGNPLSQVLSGPGYAYETLETLETTKLMTSVITTHWIALIPSL
jgi:hypothetical protein